jgi:hypothetical protein
MMAAFGKARAHARLLVESESGMAVPVALAALIASFALAGAAVLSSVDVQMGSHRDQDAKSAIAAADAGASLALLRLNRFQSSLTETNRCVGPAGEPQTESITGWCPATTVETVGGATYSYQVSAYKKNAELSVVSTGISGEVSRRVDVGLLSVGGKNIFADEHLIGQDNIHIKGDVDVETDLGTNGSVEKEGSSAVVCGNIRHGVGKTQTWKPDCDKEVAEGEKDLPAIDPPGDLSTNNSNCRLVPNCTKTSDVDTWASTNGSGKKSSEKRTSTEPWDATHSTINIGNGGTLTMGGANYYVCGLSIKGELIMAAGAKITIYIKKPSECGMSDGALQLDMSSQGSIRSTGFGTSNYNVPVIYLLGPGSVSLLGGSGADHLVLYAPESEVEIGGGASWIGMIAAKSMNLHGNPVFKSDPNLIPPEITPQSLWQRTHYVECTGTAVSPPNAYC